MLSSKKEETQLDRSTRKAERAKDALEDILTEANKVPLSLFRSAAALPFSTTILVERQSPDQCCR